MSQLRNALIATILEKHQEWLLGKEYGVRANLYGANLTGANLSEADLYRANLSEATLRGAKLTGSDLSEANLTWSDLDEADLYEASLTGSSLIWSNLNRAILRGANLCGANFSRATLSGAKISGALVNGHRITKKPLNVDGLRWPVTIIDNRMIIGCQDHTLLDWSQFTNDRISKMDKDALKFWETSKSLLLTLAKQHQAGIDPWIDPEDNLKTIVTD